MDLRITGEGPPQDAPFRLRALPVLAAAAMLAGILFVSLFAIETVKLVVKLPEPPQMPWVRYSYYALADAVIALGAIAWAKRHDQGFYRWGWPQGASLLSEALRFGLLFGVVATLVDYLPALTALKPPADNPYPLGAFNIVGWLVYASVVLAASEELIFRGLIMSYLDRTLPGRVRYRGLSVSGGGMVSAVLFALYSADFLSKPGQALLQFVYAFGFGLVYASLAERSKSLIAPMVAHGAANLVRIALVFAMVAAFRY